MVILRKLATRGEYPQRQQALVDQLVARYGSLAKLAGDSQCLVIQVQMEKMLLLDGVTTALVSDTKTEVKISNRFETVTDTERDT